MDYDFIPQAYKQFGEMNEPEEDEDETTKRGVLDRVLSPLMNTSVTSALYNITDNDPDTTFLGGIGAGLSRQLNPFKDDVTDTHTTADVLDNIFGEADGFAGKVVRGVGGFVGDVVLDPMSYTSGAVSAVGKVLRGTGKYTVAAKQADKVESANKLFKEGLYKRTEATMNDCMEITKGRFNKVPNAEVELEHIIKAEASALYESFNNRVARVMTEKAMDGDGISVGLANLPLASKKNRGNRMDSIFYKQLVTDRQLREFGDKTISPYYNALSDKIRQTKVMQAVSTNNRLYAESQVDLMGTIKKYSAMQNMAKKSTVKATGVYKAAQGLSEFNDLPSEAQDMFNELYRTGDLENFIVYYKERAKNITKSISQEEAVSISDDVLARKKEAEDCAAFCEWALKELDKRKTNFLTPSSPVTAQKRHGVSTLTEVAKDFDINGVDLEEKVFNDNKFESLLRSLRVKVPEFMDNPATFTDETKRAVRDYMKNIDIEEYDVIDFIARQKDLYSDSGEFIPNEVLRALRDEYKNALWSEFERTRDARLPYKKYKAYKQKLEELEGLEKHGAISKQEKELLHKLKKAVRDAEDVHELAEGNYDKKIKAFESMGPEEIIEDLRMSYNSIPGKFDNFIKGIGEKYHDEIAETKFSSIDGLKKSADDFESMKIRDPEDRTKFVGHTLDGAVHTSAGELDDLSTADLRNMMNGFFDNTTTTLYRYDEKVGYKLDTDTKIFNEKNFDNRTAFIVRKMLLEGRYQEANELVGDIAASANYNWTFKRIDKKIQELPMTRELKEKSGRHNIRITSPSALRYDKIDIPIYDSDKVISHSKPVYKNGWREIQQLILEGKLDEKAVNDRTHLQNIYKLGAMIDPDYVPHGVKPLPDGSLPSGISVENDFVLKHIDDLVKYDKEYATRFEDIQTKRTGKKPDSTLNASESSMENASKQVMDREDLEKAEFANTANVAQKSPGTVYGSGAVNYERSLDNVYGEECASYIRDNSAYIKKTLSSYVDQMEHDINELAKNVKNEADQEKLNQLIYQRDKIMNAEDIEGLAETNILDDIAAIFNALNPNSMFGIVGTHAPHEAKRLNNINKIIEWYAKDSKFTLDETAEFTEKSKKIIKVISDKPNIFDNATEAASHVVSGKTTGEILEESGKTLDEVITEAENSLKNPIDDLKKQLAMKAAKNVKNNIAEKGYRNTARMKNILEGVMPNDILYIIRSGEIANETRFNNMIRNMNEVELQNFLSKAGPEEMEVYRNVVFRDALFDDATWFAARKDPEVAEYCKQKLTATIESLNKELEVLDGINITDEVSAIDALGELAYFKNLGESRESWGKMMDVLHNMEDPDAVITVFSGMQKKVGDVVKELDAMNKVNPHNYVEMMTNIIPRTVTEDAQKYMRTLTEVDRNLTYGITPKMSIAEANKIMKERTGVEKWYNDSIAEAFTGFMVESGKDIHQSGTVNQILHSFGKKFNLEDDIPEGETIVVKAGALKSYLSKGQSAKSGKKVINADLSELSKYGLNPDEVQYNTLFVELDKDAYKSILKDYSTGENYLNAYTMTKDNAKLFNDAAHYQNVESESAFWSMYDKFLTVFKTVNTVPNPGFHINNAAGNAFNSFLYCGAAALNPHKINIARTIIKNPDPKQYININGTKISYADMHDMFRKCGVTGGYFEAEAAKEIKEHWRTLPIIKQGLRVGTEIEEVQRGALFIEAMMNGNTPSEAMDVVNEFLFDYADLTPQEVKVMKRAIPFYTFMRKNVPLQLREMMLQPELYRNLTKGLNNFERLSGENYVRDENRSEWRQDYVQVPFKFKGQTFGFDPNLPYEQLDRLTPSKLLGQMTPAIKAPIELASREYAYTGMPVGSLQEYITNQFSIPRAVAVTETKYGADKTLYPMGQLLGMPAGTIRDFSE